MLQRRVIPVLVVALGLGAAAPAAHAAGGGGQWNIRQGVRLSGVSFVGAAEQGRLHAQLLVVGRATGAPRTMVLSVEVCRTGAAVCRREASERLRFVARPRTLEGWRVSLRGEAKITSLHFHLAPAGARRATMSLLLPRQAWAVRSARPGLFVRESRTVLVDSVAFRAAPVAGGGAAVRATATVRTPSAFDLGARIGACGDFVGCPLPEISRTFNLLPGGRNQLAMDATLSPPRAGTTSVRFRGDGGVTPSPFLSFLLPWPS